MSEYELRDYVNDYMPSIDQFFQDLNIPIFERYMRAAITFVDVDIIDSSFDSKDELLESQAFYEGIIPLVNDWYWEQYGELAKNPKVKLLSGIVTPYGQPVLIKIPSTTTR